MNVARFALSHPRRVAAVVGVVAIALLLAVALLREPSGGSTSADPGPDTSGGASQVEQPIDGGHAGVPLIERDVAANDIAGAEDEAAAMDLDGGAKARAAAIAPDTATDIAPAPTTGLDAPSLDAKVVRTGTLRLRLAKGGFEEGWSDAQSVAGAFGGYIAGASRSGAGDGPRVGTITMRVPAAKFDAAVDRLRDIDGSKVEQLDVASEDVTQEFVDVQSRLRHDRRVEARLLSLLAETETVSEVLAVQARLDQLQEQMEVARGRIRYLDKVTSLSTIQLTLREKGARSNDRGKDPSTIGSAFDDAGERFSENVASAIVWTGGALPTLLVLLIIGVVGRIAWNRRPRAGSRTAPASDS